MVDRNQTFSAAVDAWVLKSKERMNAIVRESAQRVIATAQANAPIDTGFLRASIRASNSEMPKIDPTFRGDGTAVTYDSGEISLVIAGTEIGQQLFVGYTAAYAVQVHYGTSKMPPRPWVSLAAMEWPQIVSQVTEEAKSRVAGSGR
jgi:HK97 gp10 family phage protein